MVDDYLWLMVRKYLSGWWGLPTPLKNDGQLVSWDDEIPNMMGKSKFHGSKPPTRRYLIIGKYQI
jgi:hypothetical protein